MKFGYQVTFVGTVVILILAIIMSYSNKKHIAGTLRKMMIAATVALLDNSIVMASGSETVCMVTYSVFLVGIDWVLYYMMSYVMEYTGSKNLLRHGPLFFKIIMLLDSASMFLNFFFRHAFICRLTVAPDGESFYRLEYRSGCQIHLAVS